MEEKFHPNGPLKKQLAAFDVAHLLLPTKINDVVVVDVNIFNALPSMTPEWQNRLLAELPAYRALAHGAGYATDTWTWWCSQKDALPEWFQLATMCALLQPSSAAAERVFSKLRAFLSRRQEAALEDGVEASMMLNYNNEHRRRGGVITIKDHKVNKPTLDELIERAAEDA